MYKIQAGLFLFRAVLPQPDYRELLIWQKNEITMKSSA